MMQVRPIDVNEIRAVEFDCECGSMGRLTIDDRSRSVTCAVISPEIRIHVILKEDALDDEPEPGPINDILIIEEL